MGVSSSTHMVAHTPTSKDLSAPLDSVHIGNINLKRLQSLWWLGTCASKCASLRESQLLNWSQRTCELVEPGDAGGRCDWSSEIAS